MLVFYAAFTHSTNRDAVLTRQLINKLVFPNDFPDDHDEKSYHPIGAKNRLTELRLLANVGISLARPISDQRFAFFAGARFEVSRSI